MVWGVPRGGSHVASMLSVRGVRVALSPVEATVAVDDVIDTGRTAERVLDRYGIETLALVTRHEGEPYYLFPWERAELDAGLDADARDHVTRLLLLLGDEPQRAELQQTPDRVVESWKTLFAGYRPEWADLKATLNWFSERKPEMIVVRDSSFLSTCEEHLLPFFGAVGRGLPAERPRARREQAAPDRQRRQPQAAEPAAHDARDRRGRLRR